jgi:hypothetical protein
MEHRPFHEAPLPAPADGQRRQRRFLGGPVREHAKVHAPGGGHLLAQCIGERNGLKPVRGKRLGAAVLAAARPAGQADEAARRALVCAVYCHSPSQIKDRAVSGQAIAARAIVTMAS